MNKIKEFEVLSKQEIEDINYYTNLVNEKKHVVISINGRGEPTANIPHLESCRKILLLNFHDVDFFHTPKSDKIISFNANHAAQILNFIDKHKNNISLIVVQCGAGVSRSAGVAAALAYILNGSDEEIISKKPLFNELCYRAILRKYFKDKELKLPIELCFDHWTTKDNKNITSEDWVDTGVFRSGTTFEGTIILNPDDMLEFKDFLKQGYVPHFTIYGCKKQGLKEDE